MAKAVLVMDMPKTCFGCNFCHINSDGEDSCQALEVARPFDSETYEKPAWCPLRVLPEERQSIREQTIEEFEDAAIANIKMLYPGIRSDVGADKFIEWCKDNKSYIDCQNAVNLAALQLKGKGGNTDEK